jgi:hypothetical protein
MNTDTTLLEKLEAMSARVATLETENARLQTENRQLRQKLDLYIRHYFGGQRNEGLDKHQLELLLQGLPNVVALLAPETKTTTATRNGTAEVVKVEKTAVSGTPNMALITTSHIEEQNHTLRMHCRRLTRLTNAFSKKLENFEAAVALNFAYYNFVKTHLTIRMTPAMAAGIESSHWTVAELVERCGE